MYDQNADLSSPTNPKNQMYRSKLPTHRHDQKITRRSMVEKLLYARIMEAHEEDFKSNYVDVK